MTLPTDPKARKAIPVYSGFIKYFPRAICAVAELSRIGNDQHNPGTPLGWDRSKSGDEKDALMRHLIDQTIDGDQAADTDGVLHATKKAWRAMADLEKILEQQVVAEVVPSEPRRCTTCAYLLRPGHVEPCQSCSMECGHPKHSKWTPAPGSIIYKHNRRD